jgi:hypothetical protein
MTFDLAVPGDMPEEARSSALSEIERAGARDRPTLPPDRADRQPLRSLTGSTHGFSIYAEALQGVTGRVDKPRRTIV